MLHDDMQMLEVMTGSGVPVGVYTGKDDFLDAVAFVLEVNKRQVRDWLRQGAIKKGKVTGAYMVIRCGRRAGVLVRGKVAKSV